MAWVDKYVTAAGAGAHDGTSLANAWTLAEAIAAPVVAGNRVNVQSTAANTTTSRSLSITGTTTAPVWWRGFNTTNGDCDADPTLAKPTVTFTTGLLTIGGAHQFVSSLDVTSQNTGRAINVTGTPIRFYGIRCENTNAAAGSHTVSFTGTSAHCQHSWFKATSSATRVVLCTGVTSFVAPVFEGGGVGLEFQNRVDVSKGVFNNLGSHGAQGTTTAVISIWRSCTFYSCGGDGIRFDVIPTTEVVIEDCIFSETVGTAINNNSGANTNIVHRSGNLFHSNGTNEAGFGDSPSLNELTDSSSPFTNAAGGDLTIVSTSTAKGTAFRVENQTYSDYTDKGAVQRAEAGAGSSGIIVHPGMAGGLRG